MAPTDPTEPVQTAPRAAAAQVAGAGDALASESERPLRRDAERNRRLILDAARELFERRGLGVTLNDIAHHAGVGVGTVYRRFPDKEQLIDALLEDRLADLVDNARAAAEDPDPWHGLTSFLERALELQATDRGAKELLLSAGRGRERTATLRQEMGPLIGALVERAKAAGQVRPDMARQDALVIQMMLGAVIDCARDVEPQLWKRYLDIILQGLKAKPGIPPPTLGVQAPDDEQLGDLIAAWRPPSR